MKIKLFEHPKLAALGAGIASVFALPPYYQIWLPFITFGILAYLLNYAQNHRRAFAIGYWFGFGFFAVGLSWISHALALDLASFGWLIPIALIAAGAFFGIFVALPAWISSYFCGFWSKIIIFSTTWAIMEWVRSFFLTGFPWNQLGSVLAFNHSLLQTASCFGTYGLSLIVCLAFMLPTAAFISPYRRNAVIGIGSILLIASTLIGFGTYRTQRLDNNEMSDINIRVVQPSIPQNLKWDFGEQENNFADYIEMSENMGFEQTNVVIWGETASTFPLKIDRAHFYQMLTAVPDDGYLITGSIDYIPRENDRWLPVNAGLIFRHGKGIIDSYSKSHLVPFGEYLPLRRFLPETLRPITKVITDFQAGEGPKTFNLDKLPPFGLLICYEIIFPHQVADADNRPQWLINLTNDGWYGMSSGPYQHLTAAQLRAVEEGLTIVRAANSGISALISRSGKIITELGLHKRGNLDFKLPQQLSVSTLYSKYGNICFGIMALLFGLSALFMSHLHRRHKKTTDGNH